jgi:chromosome segregation ATPase
MALSRATALLDLAADLERRDELAAQESSRVADLAERADEIAARARELDDLIAGGPSELAAADRRLAESREALHGAEERLGEAERRASTLESGRPSNDEREELERALAHAREQLTDAAARADRAARHRDAIEEEQHVARAEARELSARGRDVAAGIAEIARVSDSGREPPGTSLDGLAAWGDRVHAALLVVRGQLDVERDRLVREANELAAAVLGEQVAGQSVALVARRVRSELGG